MADDRRRGAQRAQAWKGLGLLAYLWNLISKKLSQRCWSYAAGDGFGDKAQGCCNACCQKVCRTSPWTQVICWAFIALTISTAVTWEEHYLTSGIIILVHVMLFSSCLCCCSVFSLCCGDFPKVIKIIGILLLIIVGLALSVYVGWVTIGTYFAIEIRSADTVCRNTIIYLVLLYIYLVILSLVGIILIVYMEVL